MNSGAHICCFVSPILAVFPTAPRKRLRWMTSQPCMKVGRFARRDVLKYLPLLVTVFPSAVRSQARKGSPQKGGSSNNDNASQQQVPQADIDPGDSEPEITDRAYLDISINKQPSQRLIIGLYGTIAPKTVANFVALCENGYANTKIYRIVPGLTVQLGDVLNNDGKSGRAATDSGWLEAETFRITHSVPGIVSMVTKNGRVDSRFFVATRKGDSKYLDGKYVAFGRVIEGLEILDEVEREGEGFVRKPVWVVASGIMR